MTKEEVLDIYINYTTLLQDREYYELLSDIFLESENPKQLVDKAHHNKQFYWSNLNRLRDEVYDLPVDGYKNLYDYICSIDQEHKVEVSDNYQKKPDYKDITVKWLGLVNLDETINSELLYSVYHETGKSYIDEFQDQLEVLIKESNSLLKVDSLKLAKDFYKRGLARALRYCNEDLFDQIVDEEKNKTVLDILVENNDIYGLPIAGVCWKNQDFSYNEYSILDKVIPSLDKTIFEYILDNDYFDGFNYYHCDDDIEFWKKILRLVCKIGRFDLLKDMPCKYLKWKVDEDNPNSIDYYGLLKENKIKYKPKDYITDIRVAYDYLMEDNADLEYFLTYCHYDTFKSNYAKEKNQTIAILFFSILYQRTYDEIKIIANTLYYKGWVDEEIICAALYKGIILEYNNRDFYDMHVGINANHALDYAIYDDGKKEKYAFNVDTLSAKFIKSYEKDSDENTLNSILTSYFAYKETNPIEAQKELKLLIDCKKKYPSFKILSDASESIATQHKIFKCPIVLKILNCFNYSTINHELAHILFLEKISDDEIKDIEGLLPNIQYEKTRNDCYKIGLDFSRKSIMSHREEYNYELEFIDYLTSRFGSVEEYEKIMSIEFKTMIGDTRILADYLLNKGYNQKVVNILSKAIFESKEQNSKDWELKQYLKGRFDSELENFIRGKYYFNHQPFLIYENFMDAYYGGLLNTFYKTEIRYRKNYVTSIHSEEYFQMNKNQISEMFADYVALKKLAVSIGDQRIGIYYLNRIKEECGEIIYNRLELMYETAINRIELNENDNIAGKAY